MRTFLYFVLILFGFRYCSFGPYDPDLGWHLLGGAWMVNNGYLPRQDFINSFNPEWHDYHWLGQLLFYKIYNLGGYALLRLSFGLFVGYLFKVLLDLAALRTKRVMLSSFIITVVAALLIDQVASIRPQMISLLIIALTLRRLNQRATKWEPWYLFSLAVFLVNVHVYWVFVPFLWFLFRAAPRFYRKRSASAAYAWGGLALLSSAGFVSPYGLFVPRLELPYALMNYALIWEYMDIPDVLHRTIGEFKSAFAFKGLNFWILIVSLMLISRFINWRRFLADFGNGAAAIISFYLTIDSVKYTAIFAVLGIPFFVRQICAPIGRAILQSNLSLLTGTAGILPANEGAANSSAGKMPTVPVSPFAPLLNAIQILPAAGLLLFSIYVSISEFPLKESERIKNEDDLNIMYPIKACQGLASLQLKPKDPLTHVRLLTHFDYGGWCRWAIYQSHPELDYRVTTDNRTQTVPQEHYERGFDLYNMKRQWLETLKVWAPDAAIVSKSYPLAQFMALAPAFWQKSYEDGTYAVFIPVGK